MSATEGSGDTNQQQAVHQSDGESAEKPSQSLNGDAVAFVPCENGDCSNQTYRTFTLKVPLDSKIWKRISACSASNHRIMANRRSNPMLTMSSKLFPEPKFNRTLMIDIKPDGVICIRRRDNIFIDISLDRAIRVACPMQKMHACVSGSTINATIFHPNGRIFQNDSRIDLVAFDGLNQNNLLRYAKICHKGISFMAKGIPVVYLVDEAGLRSSIDHFIHIEKDCAMDVFNSKTIPHNSFPFNDAVNVMKKSHHTQESNGSEVLEVNQIRITSNNDGTISIERMNKSCCIRINPHKAAVTLTSPHIHATASMGKSPHLFLRQGDRRIHFDGSILCLRNGGYSAGFDEKNQVTIFNKKSPSCQF